MTQAIYLHNGLDQGYSGGSFGLRRNA